MPSAPTFAARSGADVVQLDEPWMESRPEQARAFAVKAINRALEGATGTTAIHLCFGYAYIVKDGKVITRGLSNEILAGCTRRALMRPWPR